MQVFEITAEGSGSKLATAAELADNALGRMKGLLGRRSLGPGRALVLKPCWTVHTWFMRFALDVVFIDKDDVVLKVVRGMGPWRFAAARGASCAIEFGAGHLDSSVAPGIRLVMGPAMS